MTFRVLVQVPTWKVIRPLIPDLGIFPAPSIYQIGTWTLSRVAKINPALQDCPLIRRFDSLLSPRRDKSTDADVKMEDQETEKAGRVGGGV